jgi:iron complex outermembrane receptor protein|tara:strand:+ start:2494 stop:4584 length:2091 start_codon:yes stop_codon:yes gene_type:complete
MHSFIKKSGLFACAALLTNITQADQLDSDYVYVLDEYIISAGPLPRQIEDYSNPFTALDTDAIRQESGGTLGELLDGQPGVTSTSFGAGASRPIIRGFDAARVRILESGLGSLDVSETSPDHAVSVEPLLTKRIEILRGPSTLLYGSSAIGGVVNVVGREIPRVPVDPKGYEGAFETRYDTVSEGETYLGYGTVGGENWAFGVSGLTRKTENYEIPGEAEAFHEEEAHEEDDHEEEASGDTLENSFVENDFISVGGTWFFGEQSYLGASFSSYDAFYGVPGHGHHEEEAHDDHEEEDHHEEEEGVAIDLERKRFDLELALFEPIDWIEAVRIRFGYTDYEHLENEGDEMGTVFQRDGWEFRAEAAHHEWTFIDEGIFGIDISDTRFEAIGEEGAAFGPPTETRNQAFFISEQIHQDKMHYEFGGRLEAQQIDAEGGLSDYSGLALSLAAGLIYEIDENNSLALSLQRSQRNPTSSELYANGAHLATSQFEIGDADLELETAYGVDLSYRHSNSVWNTRLSVFYTYFEDYIFAEATGAEEDELAVFAFTALDASFYGLEAELEYLLIDSSDIQFKIGLLGDFVKTENHSAKDALPRTPPLRIGGKVRLIHGNWDTGVILRHAFEQNDTAPLETETDGYTELQADLSYTFDLSNDMDFTLFVRADNLLDEEIRPHTSFLKDDVLLSGRNFTLGARLEF